MIRNVALEEISDGKLYGLNDMVRAGCDECKDCCSCCEGMGQSVTIDPYDMHRMLSGLKKSAGQLLAAELELNVTDGIILPNLKMEGEKERCAFLDPKGRCSIHQYRPGICRLFPLGRYYEENGFRYFLQVHECKKENRTKVKVRKWIDTPEPVKYEKYILDWHNFLAGLRKLLNHENAKEISMYVLTSFFLEPYGEDEDFYGQFYGRMLAAQEKFRWEV